MEWESLVRGHQFRDMGLKGKRGRPDGSSKLLGVLVDKIRVIRPS